jgi:phage gpG-like protein
MPGGSGSGVTFSFEVDGEAQVSLAIGRMIRAVDDMRPFAPAFQSAFRNVELQQFAGAGVGPGGKWAALSEPYATRKRARWGNKPILRASDALYAALTGDSSLMVAEPRLLVFGTATDYGMYHQRGGGSLPRRKVIDVSPAQQKREFGRALGEMARSLGLMWQSSGYHDVRLRG